MGPTSVQSFCMVNFQSAHSQMIFFFKINGVANSQGFFFIQNCRVTFRMNSWGTLSNQSRIPNIEKKSKLAGFHKNWKKNVL